MNTDLLRQLTANVNIIPIWPFLLVAIAIVVPVLIVVDKRMKSKP